MLKIINTILATVLSSIMLIRLWDKLSLNVIALCIVTPILTFFVKDKKQYFVLPAILLLFVIMFIIY